MKILRDLWNSFMDHALEQVTIGVDSEEKYVYLLSAIDVKKFNNFNIYNYPNNKIEAFADNIIRANELLKTLVVYIEQNKNPVPVFDSFQSQTVSVHTYFIDKENYYIDVQEQVSLGLESLNKIASYLARHDNTQEFNTSRNYSIVKANVETFLNYTHSLYELEKNINPK